MSSTFQTLAQDALEDLGCLRPGQTPSTDVLNSMLRRTNRQINAWLIDNLMAYAYPAQVFTLTAGVQQYLIGPGATAQTIGGVQYGAFNTTRPTDIRDANIILNTFSPVVRSPLALIDVDSWSLIRVQQLQNAIPLQMYYDNDFSAAAGWAVINLWPGPLTTYQIELFSTKTLPFSSFADLNSTSYLFPPAYERLIQLMIAAENAAMLNAYCKTARMDALMAPSSEMLKLTLERYRVALAEVQSDNAIGQDQACDPAFTSAYRGPGWVYATGDYGRRKS